PSRPPPWCSPSAGGGPISPGGGPISPGGMPPSPGPCPMQPPSPWSWCRPGGARHVSRSVLQAAAPSLADPPAAVTHVPKVSRHACSAACRLHASPAAVASSATLLSTAFAPLHPPIKRMLSASAERAGSDDGGLLVFDLMFLPPWLVGGHHETARGSSRLAPFAGLVPAGHPRHRGETAPFRRSPGLLHAQPAASAQGLDRSGGLRAGGRRKIEVLRWDRCLQCDGRSHPHPRRRSHMSRPQPSGSLSRREATGGILL